MEREQLDEIKKKVFANKERWRCGETPITQMDDNKFTQRLGLKKLPEDAAAIKRIESYEMEISRYNDSSSADDYESVYPLSWDWRGVRKLHDWTTPVRNQGPTYNCLAYALVATMEARYRIQTRKLKSTQGIDLSEEDVFKLPHDPHIGPIEEIESILKAVSENGISSEALPGIEEGQEKFFPGKPFHTKNWERVKEFISSIGPMIATMNPSEDFSGYQCGVFSPVQSRYCSTHAVCIVGYDDADKYWIGKNSWGYEWGEKGWFRIKYRKCALGADGFWGIGNVDSTLKDIRLI